jgi:hypothetical protein
MGFKKLVILACDGPCGLALPGTEKAPEGWTKTMIVVYQRLASGQKPSNPVRTTWLCPKCSELLVGLLAKNHFALSEGPRKDDLEGEDHEHLER